MPEGHSIHRLAGQLQELVGQRVAASSPQGKLEAGPVDGAEVTRVEAYGKHLLVDTSAATVHVHLGMRGKFLRFAPVTGPALGQVRLRLATEEVAWDLIAPTTCELLDADGRAGVVARLGPDPLRDDGDEDEAYRRLHAYRGGVGAALMDQSVLAGVGNVFRAEILHACRIAPSRPASEITPAEFAELWQRLQAMMAQGVADGRIITVAVPPDQERLDVPEAESRRVYKRDVCADCGADVTTTQIDGRTSYACPRCQPA